MSDRVIFLDVDGVVLLSRFSGGVEAAARITGRQLDIDDEVPWMMDDAVRVKVPGINDAATPVLGWFRPAVIDTLRAVHERGTHIEWLTSWLTHPDRLTHLATTIGLEFVAVPDLLGIEPKNNAIPPEHHAVSHWKSQRILAESRQVLWIDDQLSSGFMQHMPDRIFWIVPSTLIGLVGDELIQIGDFSLGRTKRLRRAG